MNYNQISEYFYKNEELPGKKTFYDWWYYYNLEIGGVAQYNNCYITSNNNLYFKILKGRNNSHFELINDHKQYLIIEGAYNYYSNSFSYYEIKVEFDLSFKLPSYCKTNKDIEVKYITQV